MRFQQICCARVRSAAYGNIRTQQSIRNQDHQLMEDDGEQALKKSDEAYDRDEWASPKKKSMAGKIATMESVTKKVRNAGILADQDYFLPSAKQDMGILFDELNEPPALNFDHIPIQDQVVLMFPGIYNYRQFKEKIDNPESLRLFKQATDILGFDLLNLLRNGSKSMLYQIYYAELITFVTSMASFEKFKKEQPKFEDQLTDCAGYGVGELCALVAGGAIYFQDALKLVKFRAEAIQECSQKYPSGLIQVKTCAKSKLTRALLEASAHAREKEGVRRGCDISSFLYSHMKLVGGTNTALDYFMKYANSYDIQIIERFPFNGALHTCLMDEAAQKVGDYLRDEKVEWRRPKVNVYSNYTGKVHNELKAMSIASKVAKQINNPIRWEQIAKILSSKHQDYIFPSFFELGVGTSLGDLLTHASKKMKKSYLNYPP